MSTEHLFQEAEESPIADLVNPIEHPTIPGAVVEAGLDPSAYKVSKTVNQSIRTGTGLPMATRTGGIVGSTSLAGYIKPGRQWEKDPESGDLLPVRASPLTPELIEECTSGISSGKVQAEAQPVPKQTKKQKKNSAAIETLLKEIPEVMEQAPVKKVKVKLSGYFGEFTGNYLQAMKSKSLVVLALEEDANGFVPPISDEKSFTITMYTEGTCVDFEVHYLGLEFVMFEKHFYLFHLAV